MIKLLALSVGLVGSGILMAAATTEEPGGLSLGGFFWPILTITLLITLNGLFVAAEFALIGVRPTQMEQMANDGNRIARSFLTILRSSKKQKLYIATAQVGITAASLALGMYGEPKIAGFVESVLARLSGVDPHDTLVVTIGYLSAVAILTYLHIVGGEMIPKSLALSAPTRAAMAIAQFMQVMQVVFAIPVYILTGIGTVILRLIRVPPATGHARFHSPEELDLIVHESAQGGLLNMAEEEMIRNILDFTERDVHQVMTPRPKIQAISSEMPLPEILELATESNYSRFPVYEDNLDHIIGVVHIKDLVRQHLQMKGKFDIRLLLRPVHVVPEHYSVEKLLAAFKRRRYHMAIVLDEFGGTAGAVTLEDLVEEVVGEVRDEFDIENEPLVRVSSGVLEVAGDYLIDDLAEYVYLGQADTLPDVDTVGGLIMAELGRVPQPGDQVAYNDQVILTVLATDGLAVARVQVEFPTPGESEQITGAPTP